MRGPESPPRPRSPSPPTAQQPPKRRSPREEPHHVRRHAPALADPDVRRRRKLGVKRRRIERTLAGWRDNPWAFPGVVARYEEMLAQVIREQEKETKP
jgi:hypothetical protein